MNTREKRVIQRAAIEIRGEGTARTIVGRAVEYDTWSEKIYGHFRERIAPGAFDESLAREGRDVYASLNHNEDYLLGRESAGTLSLKPDGKGIAVEVPMPDYSYARDLEAAIRRGDMRGMSFIFDVVKDTWESRDGVPHRTVTKADIYEVAFVYFPAYPATSAGVRAIPLAHPVEGEKVALQRLYAAIIQPGHALKKKRLTLQEK